MVSSMESFTGPQLPFPAPLSVSTTEPLAMSFAPGVYTGNRMFGSLKVPSPAVCQSSALVFDALGGTPEAEKSCVPPWHISSSEPASTTGSGVMVSVHGVVHASVQEPLLPIP